MAFCSKRGHRDNRLTFMATSNASLGAAMGGAGAAKKLPGTSLPTLVLERLGYQISGAPRLVSADWRRESDRLYGREREIQLTLEEPHDELLAHFLNRAVETKAVDEVRRLLAAGADPNAEVQRLLSSTPTPGGPTMYRWLNAPPPLELACCWSPALYGASEFEVCELLLEAGADPDVSIRGHQTLIRHASQHRGRTEFVRRLFAYGANPDLHSKTGWGSALFIATAFNHHEGVELLLSAGADIEILYCGSTPLHTTVESCKNGEKHRAEDGVATARILLSRGADVDAVDEYGRTPLNIACRDGAIKGAKVLLLHGAAFDRPDNEGVTPLAASRALICRPRTLRQQHLEFEEDHNAPFDLDGIDNGPALNAMFDDYLKSYWLRARVCAFGRQIDTSARCAVAAMPELSRQVGAFLVGDIPSIRV